MELLSSTVSPVVTRVAYCLNKLNPLINLECHKARAVTDWVKACSHMCPNKVFFLSAQNVGNVITAKTVPS